MKFSKILEIENLQSVTIEVDKEPKVKALVFFKDGRKNTKTYSSLEIDVDVKECSISAVSHFGIKRYRFWQCGIRYANIYNYK